ncbi:MAG: 4Fe-4S binding protein [Coriobacteriia bacterium]|nr:4Fe-4S binding protein [Coriobacteriia bacterium]
MKTGKILPKAIKNLFSKPATSEYPAKKDAIFDDYRGLIAYNAEACIGCMSCKRDCPTGAIDIEKVGDKQYKATLRIDRCVFCGQCVESCPRDDALWYTSEFELAGLTKDAMKIDVLSDR